MKIVLASNNQGKLKEFKALFSTLDIEVIPQAELGVEDVEETGLSFIENALLKARHASQMTQLPALADDSGLAVDYLQGAPGIYSARYAGEHGNAQANIQKLLTELQDMPDAKRQAHFHCVLALVQHALDPVPVITHGVWSGSITTSLHGQGGFGYDPVFYVNSHGCTAAELDPTVKNQVSHRAQAMQQLLHQLNK